MVEMTPNLNTRQTRYIACKLIDTSSTKQITMLWKLHQNCQHFPSVFVATSQRLALDNKWWLSLREITHVQFQLQIILLVPSPFLFFFRLQFQNIEIATYIQSLPRWKFLYVLANHFQDDIYEVSSTVTAYLCQCIRLCRRSRTTRVQLKEEMSAAVSFLPSLRFSLARALLFYKLAAR